jgi:hypothetical protein
VISILKANKVTISLYLIITLHAIEPKPIPIATNCSFGELNTERAVIRNISYTGAIAWSYHFRLKSGWLNIGK